MQLQQLCSSTVRPAAGSQRQRLCGGAAGSRCGAAAACRAHRQQASSWAAAGAAALLLLSPAAVLAEDEECFGPTCTQAGRNVVEAFKGYNDPQKQKLAAADEAFAKSDTLKALLEKSEANKAKNKREIQNKYCYRQAELGIGDCGGLRLIPGMTKNGKQPTPEWLQKALGVEVPEVEGQGRTLEELLGPKGE